MESKNIAYNVLVEVLAAESESDFNAEKVHKNKMESEIKTFVEKWLTDNNLGTWEDINDEVLDGLYSDDENQIFIFTVWHKQSNMGGNFGIIRGRYGKIEVLGQDIGKIAD